MKILLSVAAFVCLAILIGLLTGGRLSWLVRNTAALRLAWLAPLALIFQWVFFELPGMDRHDVVFAGHLLTYALVIPFIWVNRRMPGMPLLAAGLGLNLLVIALNGGMPVDPETLRATGRLDTYQELISRGWSGNAVALTDRTLLPFLADRLVLPAPLSGLGPYSIGDLLIYAGGFWLLAGLTRPRPVESGTPAGPQSA